jgi:hypothetical protein
LLGTKRRAVIMWALLEIEQWCELR